MRSAHCLQSITSCFACQGKTRFGTTISKQKKRSWNLSFLKASGKRPLSSTSFDSACMELFQKCICLERSLYPKAFISTKVEENDYYLEAIHLRRQQFVGGDFDWLLALIFSIWFWISLFNVKIELNYWLVFCHTSKFLPFVCLIFRFLIFVTYRNKRTISKAK